MCVISTTLGYENQPEVLKLFRKSSSRPKTVPVQELKSSNEEESRRKSIPAGGLDPTSPSPIVDATEDKEASAVPTEESKATSRVPIKFLEELCKNEQFKASLESEQDGE